MSEIDVEAVDVVEEGETPDDDTPAESTQPTEGPQPVEVTATKTDLPAGVDAPEYVLYGGQGGVVEIQDPIDRVGMPVTGNDSGRWQTVEGHIASFRRVVPPQLLNLDPLVGPDDQQIVAPRDVDEELALGDDHVEPRMNLDRPADHLDPILGARVVDLLLGQSLSTDDQVDGVQAM